MLIIMQGAPGSGKSSFAYKILESVVCSTDDYFETPDGYRFDRDKIGEAHKWNQSKCRHFLDWGSSVVVDNTNIHAWEAKPYVQMAVDLGIPVVFVRCTGKFQNTHGVPDKVVERMRNDMEELTIERCLAAKAPWEVA